MLFVTKSINSIKKWTSKPAHNVYLADQETDEERMTTKKGTTNKLKRENLLEQLQLVPSLL